MMKNVQDSCCQSELPLELLDARNHPTPKDLERNMGTDLTEVYLKTCTPIERALFGRDKPLRGPGNLWINPEDRSSGKQLLLTPERTASVQALTHQGILSIGEKIERKIDEERRGVILKAVAEAREIAK